MKIRILSGVACAAMVLSLAGSASAQFLYEADNQSGSINTFTPNGTQSTFASGLGYPMAVAFDSTGNLFEADGITGNVYKFNYNHGTLNPTPTLYSPGSGNFETEELALDSSENVFVVSTDGNVVKIAPNGVRTTVISGLNVPVGAAVDKSGNLFVAIQNDNAIIKITPGGTVSTFATYANGLSLPNGLAFDSAGNLLVANWAAGNVLKFSPNGTPSTVLTGVGFGLTFVVSDSAGDVFVSDQQTGQILEETAGGVEKTFASGLAAFGLAIQPVPEPSTLALAAIGSGVFLLRRVRARRG